MKIDKIPIKIKQGQVVTSLYHSPFDYNLLYLIIFAKTGVKLEIVLDDIDNIGIDRTDVNSSFGYKEKYFLSKTERTNLRPLTLTLPKHLLLNLAYPNIKDLDNEIPINNLKKILGYEDTVDHWIQETTKNFGVNSLIGSDKSYACLKVDDDFIKAINDSKKLLKKLLNQFEKSESALNFIEEIFSLDILIKDELVSEYYLKVLNRIIEKFDLSENVSISKMSDQNNQDNNLKLLSLYEKDENLQKKYREALNFLKGNDYQDFPFYAISKENGERMLPINKYFENPSKYLIAPKVLMLNNFENLILPDHASESPNVFAREIMYKNKNINCNQIFCDEKWSEHISGFDLKLNLDDIEKDFYDKEDMSFNDLLDTEFSGGEISKYKNWVIKSTIRSIKRSAYPLIFLALLQDQVFYKDIPEIYQINIKKL
jgi:hypothetical protein